jgi:hypothetical protein
MDEIIIQWPTSIKVSGWSFWFQGWNAKYNITDKVQGGAPVYKLEEYSLFKFIPIIGVEIYKDGQSWYMKRDCDVAPMCSRDGKYPWGNWYGARMADEKSNVTVAIKN